MKQLVASYLVPVLSTVTSGVLAFTAFTLWGITIELSKHDGRIAYNTTFVAEVSEESEAAMQAAQLALEMARNHVETVPQLISDTLEVQSLNTQLNGLVSERTRLHRVVNGFTVNPPASDGSDEADYLSVLDEIEKLCSELLNHNSEHRACL